MKTNNQKTKNIYRIAITLGLFTGLCSCSSNKMANIGCGYGYEEIITIETDRDQESDKNYRIISTDN